MRSARRRQHGACCCCSAVAAVRASAGAVHWCHCAQVAPCTANTIQVGCCASISSWMESNAASIPQVALQGRESPPFVHCSAFLWSATLLVLSTLLAGMANVVMHLHASMTHHAQSLTAFTNLGPCRAGVVTADAGPWRFAIIVSLAVALEESVRWWLYSLHRRVPFAV